MDECVECVRELSWCSYGTLCTKCSEVQQNLENELLTLKSLTTKYNNL